MYAIQLEQLTKRYGKSRGIEEVNLTVNEGEVFGFIGPNGAGKSTTIRTMLDFIHPTSGSARILGLDSVQHTKSIKRRVGYLPSEVNYYDDMTVLQLLRYSAAFYGIRSIERIKALADRLDLSLSSKLYELSLGNKKKVAIVQALLHQPELLILDEPTGGLDPLMQVRFFEILRDEQARGVTIFFSSHILTEVQAFCDRVAVVKEGSVIQVEQVEALRSRSTRKVRLVWSQGQRGDTTEMAHFEGTREWHEEEHGAQFYFSGSTQVLLNLLAKQPLDQLWIEEPSLEEVVMHYYAEES